MCPCQPNLGGSGHQLLINVSISPSKSFLGKRAIGRVFQALIASSVEYLAGPTQ